MKIVQRILGRDLSNMVKVRDVVGVRENMRVSVEMFEQCCALGRGIGLASAEGARGTLVGGGRWNSIGPRSRAAHALTARWLLAKVRQGSVENRLRNSSLIFDRNSPVCLHNHGQTQTVTKINRARLSCIDCWLMPARPKPVAPP